MEKPIHHIKGKSVCVSVCVRRDVNEAQFGSDLKCEIAGVVLHLGECDSYSGFFPPHT